ncbi:MAG: hypothetical protein OEL19_05905 [Sulfurimonas sp.]|nr:hypothetical protein [Sulfurimonas sp.]
MLYKTIFYTFLSSLFFAGCVSQQPQVKAPKAPASKSDYVSQSGYYYALIEKNKEGWKILEIEDKPVVQRKFTNQEILRVTESYDNVYPHFEDELKPIKLNYYLCKETNSTKYTPCTTRFSTLPEAQNVSQLIAHADDNVAKYKYISKTEIDRVVNTIKLFDAIEAKKEVFKFALCQEQFQNAATTDELEEFVKKYADYEKANEMLQLANKNLQSLRESLLTKQEAPQKPSRTYQDLYHKSEQQLERDNIYLAKKEESAIHQHANSVEAFRKKLQVGMQTNCGTILELDAQKAKISLDEKSESHQWIERRKIFPKGEGCRFVRGKYIAPPSF